MEEDVVVYQTAIKNNNLRKYLCLVREGKTMEFDLVEKKRLRGSKFVDNDIPTLFLEKGNMILPTTKI